MLKQESLEWRSVQSTVSQLHLDQGDNRVTSGFGAWTCRDEIEVNAQQSLYESSPPTAPSYNSASALVASACVHRIPHKIALQCDQPRFWCQRALIQLQTPTAHR